MTKRIPYLEDKASGRVERLTDEDDFRHGRIRFRHPSGGSTDYIEVIPRDDGRLEIRCAQGILVIRPSYSNSVMVEVKPL